MKFNEPVTQIEVKVANDQKLISMTNVKGIITFVNQDFLDISGFNESELLQKNHNVIRHPDTPPTLFQDLWGTIQSGQPWNGIIKNRCKNGDFYWVDACVTMIEINGNIIGYQSVRSAPSRQQVAEAKVFYKLWRDSD